MRYEDLIWIPGNVPSSKNGKVWTGKFFVVNKTVASYYRDSRKYYALHQVRFKKLLEGRVKPIVLMLHFIRGSKHKWDFDNACNTILDGIKQDKNKTRDYAWIDDDSTDYLIPTPLAINGQLWSYDKENPGVWIGVLDAVDYASRCGILK